MLNHKVIYTCLWIYIIMIAIFLVGCDTKYTVDYAHKKYNEVVSEGKAYKDSTEYHCYAWTDSTCSVANKIGDSLTFRYSGVCPAVITGDKQVDREELRSRGMLVE